MALASGWAGVREVDAFERLFSAEYARVVGIAYRVLSDAHEAEDVAQDVFSSFYGKHSSDAPYAAPWLYRAAAHAALNQIRGRRRRERREVASFDTSEMAPDPQRAVIDAEQRREVRAALARLPEKYASCLALRYSGLSYADVADALGVGIGQVGTILRRAEAALRKELIHDTPR